ncbi:MAG: hypothetical protein R3C56_13075 [Pirellulaceae bacterium]
MIQHRGSARQRSQQASSPLGHTFGSLATGVDGMLEFALVLSGTPVSKCAIVGLNALGIDEGNGAAEVAILGTCVKV